MLLPEVGLNVVWPHAVVTRFANRDAVLGIDGEVVCGHRRLIELTLRSFDMNFSKGVLEEA